MCSYCEADGNVFLIKKKIPGDKPTGLQVAMSFGKLGARCYGEKYTIVSNIDIHYCPMCGRDLSHEHERLEEYRKRINGTE